MATVGQTTAADPLPGTIRRFCGAKGSVGVDPAPDKGISICLNVDAFCGLMATYRTVRPLVPIPVVVHLIEAFPPLPPGVIPVPPGAGIAAFQPIEWMSLNA